MTPVTDKVRVPRIYRAGPLVLAGAHFAIRPRGPAAHPAERDANATLLYATVSTIAQLSPPSSERAVPARPTATSMRPCVPGTYATADMYPCGNDPCANRHVAPPSLVSATLSLGSLGFV